jgi:hypothetical protein
MLVKLSHFCNILPINIIQINLITMKKLLVLALIILWTSAFAQKDTVGLNVPFVNNTVVYEKVFNVPTAPKTLLYGNAGLWFAETHPYVEDTQLQLVDPVLSRVVGRVKSSTVVTNKALWNTLYTTITYNFTVQVDCKDNKYRVRIYNIEDVIGTDYIPVDDLMFALSNSKSYNPGNPADALNISNLKQHFQALNTVIGNVMADITKSMMANNGF